MKLPKLSWLQWLTHLGALVPLAVILWLFFTDGLTVNPIQDITFRTGKAALVLLVLSLACTPLNSLFGWRMALKLRRPLGLYAFLYVCLHFLTFVGLDYGFDVELLKEAIFEKRYALVGFAAFLILIPLAVTSTKGWQKRLGKTWKLLHQGVYLAAPLAVIHYVWLVKSDVREPLAYGAVVAALLLVRVPAVKRLLKGAGRVLVPPPQRARPLGPAHHLPADGQD
jgi:sulfoxide reductase heme-binding subunit YedZ